MQADTSLGRALAALRALDALPARQAQHKLRDPRAQLLATLMFILTVLSFGRHDVAALLPLALFPTVLAAQGQVSAGLVWRTVLLATPFALAVGLLNPWFETAPMLTLGGFTLSAGWVSLAAIVLRVALTVSATLVLVATTGVPALCNALARLGVPRVLTVQLLLLYRYLFVLAGEASRMDTARRLRSGRGSSMPLKVYASLLGQLLLRSVDRSQRLHQAMLARGFKGDLHAAPSTHWQSADSLFVAGWAAFFIAMRWLDGPGRLGRLLLGAWT